jgi:hypothetical protein
MPVLQCGTYSKKPRTQGDCIITVTAEKRTMYLPPARRLKTTTSGLGIAFQWTVYRISESESLQSVPGHRH